jgi:hypothetical protein
VLQTLDLRRLDRPLSTMPDERLYDIANLVCDGDTLAAYGTCSWTNVYVASCARALCLGDRYLTLSSPSYRFHAN